MAVKNLFRKINISSVINAGATDRNDLELLAKKLINGPVKINWLKDYDKNNKGPQILNLGNPNIGGSHWCATYNGKYFDPFGLPSPPQLQHLEWVPLQIQSIKSGHCGQYSLLWLYYMMRDEEDQFYNQFTIDV